MYALNAFAQHSHDGPTAATGNKSYELIKTLEGSWTGHFRWSGAITAKGDMDAVYSLTGNGSTIVEDLVQEGKKTMTSVYHMDGQSLRMTHFCGANNQPRLIEDASHPMENSIEFKFLDITNLVNSEAGHVIRARLDFQSKERVNLTFTFLVKGKESNELIELTRKN
jgi:hypothetical protein